MKQWSRKALLVLLALMMACPSAISVAEEAETPAPAVEEAPQPEESAAKEEPVEAAPEQEETVEAAAAIEAAPSEEPVSEQPEAEASQEAEAQAEVPAETESAEEESAAAAEPEAAEAETETAEAAEPEATEAVEAAQSETAAGETPEVTEAIPEEAEATAEPAADETLTIEMDSIEPAEAELAVIMATANSNFSADPITLATKQTAVIQVHAQPEGKLTYATGNKKIATVDKNGKVKGVRAGTTTITVTAADGQKAECAVTVIASPKKIALNVNKATLGTGDTLQLSYKITENTMTAVTWSSSNKRVATVDQNGLVTAVGAGKANIVVKTHNGKKSTLKLVVKKSPTFLNAKQSSVTLGAGQSLSDAFTWDKGAYALLTSSTTNAGVAKIENNTIVAVGPGSATVTVRTSNGLSASVTVNVSAAPTSISLPQTSLELGVKQTASLTATTSTGANSGITYTSSKKKVVSVDENGNITARRAGTAVITAETYNGLKATCTVKVLKAPSSIKFSSKKLAISVDQTRQLEYTVTKNSIYTLTYESSNTDVVRVTQDGKITGVKAGTAAVRVKTQNNKSATVKVTVYAKPTKLTIGNGISKMGVGQKANLNVTVDTDNPNAVTYTSSNASVAKVSDKGEVRALAAGTARITAQTYNGLTKSVDVTVQAAPSSVKLQQTSVTLSIGESYTIAPILPSGSYGQIAYKSSSAKRASVTENGVVTAKAAGTAKITVSTYNKKTATLKVTVLKAPSAVKLEKSTLAMEQGDTAQMLYAFPKSSGASVTWTSDNAKVATVDAAGLVTCVGPGTATIKITTANGKTDSCKITCSEPCSALRVNGETTVKVGQVVSLNVSALTASGSTYSGDITYTSSDESIAKVSGGSVIGKKIGTCTITVKANGKTATATVNVIAGESSEKAATIIAAAMEKLGSKYVYASQGPDTFDCSGLVNYAYAQAGIKIPASSAKQSTLSAQLALEDLQPADIMSFDTSSSKRGYVNHSGIYLGDGQFIHASSSAGKVIISTVTSGFYQSAFMWGQHILD